METPSNVFADKMRKMLLEAHIQLKRLMYAYGSDYPTEQERIQLIASLPTDFDISVLKHCHEILEGCIRTRISLKDDALLNLPGILETVDLLLNKKEIQEQLALLPKEETLDPNTRHAAFTQEKFSRLLFLCREISPTGRTIFEQNQSKIQVTTSLLTSVVLDPISDKPFQWCTQRWISDNPGQQFPINIFERLLKKSIVNENTRWSQTYNHYIFHRNLPSEEMGVFLSGVLPLMGLRIIASLQGNEFDASLLEDYSKALDYLKQHPDLNNKKILNLPDILSAIDFLLNQKEVQEQLALAPKEETLDRNAYTIFTQEKFAKLLFLCREISPEGRTIFEQNQSKIQATTPLLTFLISSSFPDEIFQWCATKWISENPSQPFSREILNNTLMHYIRAVANSYYSSTVEPEKARTTATETFRNRLQTIATVNKNMTWEGVDSCSSQVLPLTGLQIMASLPGSKFNASLLKHYLYALDSCKKNSTVVQDNSTLKLPDILNAIDFLLNQKEVQEQLVALPREETLDANTKHTAFTQEKFARLLFLCREINPEGEGRAIFEKNQSKIQVTTSLLVSMIASPCPDETFQWYAEKWITENPTQPFPKEPLNNALILYTNALANINDGAETIPTITKATQVFENCLKRIMTVNKSIRWETPTNHYSVFHRYLPAENTVFLFNVLPSAGLQAMASLCPGVFDVSLLTNYHQALDYCATNSTALKDKHILNLPDILDAIDFLLNQKEIQEQLILLPKEETLNYSTKHTAFTQEKIAKLLFLCRETSPKGRTIFEQNQSTIHVTTSLLVSMIASPCSDEIFQLCATKWTAENPTQQLPKALLNKALIDYTTAIGNLNYTASVQPEAVRTITETFKRSLTRIVLVNKNIRWGSAESNYLYHGALSLPPKYEKTVVFLFNVLPLAGLQAMESVCRGVFDVILLAHYHNALDYCEKNSTALKDKNVLNLPDILDAVAFLLSQKEIQEQLALLPKEDTLDSNTRYTAFTQEKFTQLLFLCREVSPEGRAIFEQNKSHIHVTTSLLVSMIASPCSDETFQCFAEKWAAENPTQQLPKEPLNNALIVYTSAIGNINDSAEIQAEKIRTITETFKQSLTRIVLVNKNIRWGKTDNNYFNHRHLPAEKTVFLLNVLPSAGLQTMGSLCRGVFDVSLLAHYQRALDYCKQNSTTLQDKNILNFPDILDAIDFLLNQKEIQEQLVLLPKEETLDSNTRDTAFTQEKFTQLLFLCHETGSEQGRKIFEQNQSTIEVATSLLTSMIGSPCSDALFQWCAEKWTVGNPTQQLPKEIQKNALKHYIVAMDTCPRTSLSDLFLEPEKVQITTNAFANCLKRIVSLNKNTRWEKPDNSLYLRDNPSEQSFIILFGALPLVGLQIMAALPNSEFDVSLLEHYCNALSSLDHWRQNNRILKDTKILNLPDVLGAVNLLLSRPEIQKQLTLLLKEGTTEYYHAGNPAFTQEKFAQLLFLCRETNSEQGSSIFDQYASNIQVTTALLTAVVSWSSSEAPFEWCAKKWMSANPKQELPKELMQGTLSHYLSNLTSFYQYSSTETEPKTVTETFRNSLNRIVVFNKNIKWEKSDYYHIDHTNVRSGKAIFLSNVLPLAALAIMESVRPDVFDASLLTPYYKALEYCRENSDTFKDKEILNLPDILNAISFLLNKKEIQEQLMKLPTEKSIAHNYRPGTDFTQEKFSQLLFLFRELNPEQGTAIFEQHESKIQATASLLASVASWSFNAPFEKCIQQLDGNLPEGIVGGLTKKYTTELDQLRSNSRNCSVEENNKKAQEAYSRFKLSLSRISAISESKQKPIICGEQDFSDRGLSSSHTEDEIYLYGVLPLEAIKLMKEQFNIQLNPALFVSYLHKLRSIENMLENQEGGQSKQIVNYNVLLESMQFLMQGVDAEQLMNVLKSGDDFSAALSGMSILQAAEFYEPIYKKLCLSLQKKTTIVQEYEIAAMLKIANKHKDLKLIALLSTHPHASISPDFLKISAEMNDYEGLACILEHRPEFLEKLSISNKMLTHSPKFEAIFQQRLKIEGEKHGICEKELKEIFDTLSAIPDIYVPDMVPTIIQIMRSKKLLNYAIEDFIDLEFGSFLSIWNKKGILHPEALAVGKSGESLLGSFYGYKPELYTHIVTKLRSILPGYPPSQPLSLQHQQFCFKLAVLFPNMEEVDAYFKQLVSKIDKDNGAWNIIEEASNFKTPTQGYWDIEAWFSFVKRNQFSSRDMAFLGAASDMDMKMALDDTIFSMHRKAVPPKKGLLESILSNLMGKFNNKRGAEREKAEEDLWKTLVQQCPLAYEKLIQSYVPKEMHGLQKEKEKQSSQLDLPAKTKEQLLQEAKTAIEARLLKQKDKFKLLLKNILEIYDLYNPAVKLLSLIALRLQDFPELPKEYQEAMATALAHGYSNVDIKALITFLLKNKQAFTFVPTVIVDGTDIDDGTGTNYNGYQLKPLEKTDPMALVAGLKTRCCQHFNNAGAESAMHAYTSIYGTTYRLASKKDPNNGDWFAQSWVALSECGTILLFDSIEFAAHAKEKMVLAFFKKAAEKLLASNPHLQEIWVGASEHARLKLEQHGYTRKPAGENFSIAGYSKDSYTDAENIVVLLNRSELKIKSEEVKQTQEAASLVMHLHKPVLQTNLEELKQTHEETKVNAEYRVRYGVDTYLKPGKVVKLLGLSDEARRMFNTTHAPVISLLMEDPENPLLEEGFVSSDPADQKNRYREGEFYITYKATMGWLDNTLNPKIKAIALPHQVYAAKEADVPALLQEAQQNASIKTFTVIAFIGIHAVSVFVDPKNGVCFILDSEPGTDLTKLKQACKTMAPNMLVITPEAELRLQKDFYSCATFALKSARYFAKNAETFSKLLQDNPTDVLATTDMPAALLKMAQTPLELTEEQNQTVVSQRRKLTLLQYNAALKLTIGGTPFNTAALKTRQNVLKQIHSTMKTGQ